MSREAMIDIYPLKISKSKLRGIPPKERTFFLLAGHLANELNILQKLNFWCAESASANDLEKRAHTVQTMVIVRILAGKLNEGWLMLQKAYFASKLSQEYDSLLSEDAKNALGKLKKYFGKSNCINTVRNNFSFHYSPELWEEGYELPPEDERWELWLSESNANSVYYLCEIAANYTLLNTISPGNPQQGIENLISDTIDIAHAFMTFLGEFMPIFAERNLDLGDGDEVQPVNVEHVVEFETFTIGSSTRHSNTCI